MNSLGNNFLVSLLHKGLEKRKKCRSMQIEFADNVKYSHEQDVYNGVAMCIWFGHMTIKVSQL